MASDGPKDLPVRPAAEAKPSSEYYLTPLNTPQTPPAKDDQLS
jgi:hypothetical protein